MTSRSGKTKKKYKYPNGWTPKNKRRKQKNRTLKWIYKYIDMDTHLYLTLKKKHREWWGIIWKKVETNLNDQFALGLKCLSQLGPPKKNGKSHFLSEEPSLERDVLNSWEHLLLYYKACLKCLEKKRKEGRGNEQDPRIILISNRRSGRWRKKEGNLLFFEKNVLFIFLTYSFSIWSPDDNFLPLFRDYSMISVSLSTIWRKKTLFKLFHFNITHSLFLFPQKTYVHSQYVPT